VRLFLGAVAGVLYLGLGYLATGSDHPPVSALVMGLMPLAAIALVVAWKSRRRALYLLLCAAGLGAVVWYFDALRDHIAWLYFVQHAGAMTLLGITFGRTLTDDHSKALCSRIAIGILRTPLNADYLNYTWKVTLAWTIYFFVSAVLSVLLFFLAPIGIWSLFATILTPLFLGLMFAGEYLIRQRALPGQVHFSIVKTIQAYRNFSRQ
jgi:uncharacterized membrane protein